jgi:cytosine/adenosine deaminase-related metal-dependent hydrolase
MEPAVSALLVRARRILTMDPSRPEIHDGGILVRDGRIAGLEPWAHLRGQGPVVDLGAATLVPGLINAHAHLGLSHLAGRIPAGLGFAAWADRLFTCLKEPADKAALDAAVGDAVRSGTCFLADLVGRDAVRIRQALAAQGLGGHLFQEFSGSPRALGFAPRPLSEPWSAAVHGLYSTGAEYARSIKGWCRERGAPFSLHLAEVPGENELFRTGRGEFAEFLRSRRVLPRGFVAPGVSAVRFASELGLLDQHTLAVHCVQIGQSDMELLAASGATVCLCPRSNEWIGVGQAPAAGLRAAGVPLCLGTDSLASNADMDLWAELRAVRGMLPAQTHLDDLLALVTVNPAKALGIAAQHGSLEVGKRAAWAVLPGDFD